MKASHVIIVKTSSLGDIIQALPVAKALKNEDPSLKISWIVDEKNSSLVSCFSFIDNVIALDFSGFKQGFLSCLKALFKIKARLKNVEGDALLDLQGNTKSALVTLFCKAPVKIGFGRKSVSEFLNLFVTNKKIEVDPYASILVQYTTFIEVLTLKNHQRKERIVERSFKNKVMVCPGSNWKNKMPNPRAFEEFLLDIQKKYACEFIFIGAEPEIFPSFIHSFWRGKLEWKEWMDLMQDTDMVISADSCALHLAALLEVPTFSFFGPSSSRVYAPIGAKHAFVEGSCPYGQRFIKRCKHLRTCITGSCLKNLRNEDYNATFSRHWETLFKSKSKST